MQSTSPRTHGMIGSERNASSAVPPSPSSQSSLNQTAKLRAAEEKAKVMVTMTVSHII